MPLIGVILVYVFSSFKSSISWYIKGISYGKYVVRSFSIQSANLLLQHLGSRLFTLGLILLCWLFFSLLFFPFVLLLCFCINKNYLIVQFYCLCFIVVYNSSFCIILVVAFVFIPIYFQVVWYTSCLVQVMFSSSTSTFG